MLIYFSLFFAEMIFFNWKAGSLNEFNKYDRSENIRNFYDLSQLVEIELSSLLERIDDNKLEKDFNNFCKARKTLSPEIMNEEAVIEIYSLVESIVNNLEKLKEDSKLREGNCKYGDNKNQDIKRFYGNVDDLEIDLDPKIEDQRNIKIDKEEEKISGADPNLLIQSKMDEDFKDRLDRIILNCINLVELGKSITEYG